MQLASEATAGPNEVQVRSQRFGEFAAPVERVLELPEGLIGFPTGRRFVILEHTKPSPLRWMLCIDDPNLAFAVADPAEFFHDYVTGAHEELHALGLEGPEDLGVLVIVTIPAEQPAAMTANLMAPVVVNLRTRIGRQIIVDTGRYSTRHPLMSARPDC